MRYRLEWCTTYHGYRLFIYGDDLTYGEGYTIHGYLGRDAIDIIRLRAIEYMKGIDDVFIKNI